MIFVEGTRDPFATPELLAGVDREARRSAPTLLPIEGGDHSFNVRGAKRDARAVAVPRSRRSVAAADPGTGGLMPRKNRRNPEYFQAPEAAARACGRAARGRRCPGSTSATSDGQKEYRCPGCDHIVRDGVWHLVVVPEDDPDARRHWHTECWRRELKRLGRYRPPPREI